MRVEGEAGATGAGLVPRRSSARWAAERRGYNANHRPAPHHDETLSRTAKSDVLANESQREAAQSLSEE